MKYRRLKPWHVALGTVAICGFGGIGLNWFLTYRANQDVSHALARLKSLGMPTEFAEVQSDVAPESNAAVLYGKAKWMPYPSKNRSFESPYYFGPAKVNYIDLEAYVESLSHIFPVLDKAITMPKCRFRMDGENQVNRPADVSDMPELFAMYLCSARISSHKGDHITSLAQLYKLSIMLKQINEPSFDGQVAWFFCEDAFWDEVDKEILELGHKAEFRSDLHLLLRSMRDLPRAADFFRMEIPRLRKAFAEFSDSMQNQNDEGYHRELFSDKIVQYAAHLESIRTASLAKSLNHWADVVEAMKSKPEDWRLAATVAQTVARQIDTDSSITGKICNEFANGSWTRKLIGHIATRRQLAAAALSLYDIEAKTGKFPNSLPPDNAEMQDPLSKENFIYRQEGAGFVLHSVGPNGVDDGGKLVRGPSLDIIFGSHWR